MRVAVVIPVYKQPQYLVEAVCSALRQSIGDVRVVIVNDGCPYASTHDIGVALEHAHPGRVIYVRRGNGGLSAARNTGVELALGLTPAIDAILPLDADNRLSSTTVAELAAALAAHPRVAWASPALETFGTEHFTWSAPDRFSRYRQLFDNQCDAGSLIRREVFDAGLRFDETMRHGYEDWEFFLRAGVAGFLGHQAGCCGFRYRRRRDSLLTTAVERHGQIMDAMRAANPGGFAGKAQLAIEDEDLPRFAWLDPTDGAWRRGSTATSLLDAPPRDGPDGTEALVMIASHAVLRQLDVHLAGSLLRAQACLRHDELYGLRVTSSSAPGCAWAVDLKAGSDPHLVVAPAHRLDDVAHLAASIAARHGRREVLDVGASRPFTDGPGASVRGEDLERWTPAPRTATVRPADPAADAGLVALQRRWWSQVAEQRPQGRHRDWAYDHHVTHLDTVLPWTVDAQERAIAFVVPWLRLGGVDHCVVQLARAITELRPRWSTHLVLTARPEVWGDASTLDAFSTVTTLTELDWETSVAALDATVAAADVVVNAHSGLAFDLLGRLRSRHARPAYVAYSHVLDLDEFGLPAGWPETAAELDPAIDVHLVISDRMRRYLESSGVARDKIVVGRNAPVARPASRDDVARCRRRRVRELRDGSPLRLLFAGRLDVQKGLGRLTAFADLLGRSGLPVTFTILGGSVLHEDTADFPAWVQRRPPVFDLGELSAVYGDHDVMVLLSRWEGVPLALLDAMAHGVVPLATRVGAVDELVTHDRDGVLLAANGSDADIASAAHEAIARFVADAGVVERLAAAALATAWQYDWHDTAAPLIDLAEQR